MITWEIAHNLIFERGLQPYRENLAYEDDELRDLCNRLKEIDDESIQIQDRILRKHMSLVSPNVESSRDND